MIISDLGLTHVKWWYWCTSEVYMRRSVGVDSGRSLNDCRKYEWSRSWFF